MKPYYKDKFITIFNGDSREILPQINADALITDPVWPGCQVPLFGRENPERMFFEVWQTIKNKIKRVAVHLGCDTDPGMLDVLNLPFFRVVWLEYALPGHKGRLLNTGDVAYLYGQVPKPMPGKQRV